VSIEAELAALDAKHGRDAVIDASRHALWRAGDLSYLLHAGQRLLRATWRSSTWRRFVANIGRGWGKSWWLCVEATECAIKKKKALVRYAAPEAKQVATIITPIMQQIADHAPPDMRPVWHPGDGVWKFPNGSLIYVAGANAGGADRLRGVSTDLAPIDEARDIDCLDYLVKSVLTPRLTATGRILIASTPPEMPDHPLVHYIAEAQTRGAYMHAPTSAAPHITPERMAEFLADYTGPSDPAFRREFGAEIIADPTRAVLPELSEHEAMVTQPHQRPEYYLPTIIGDLGYEDLTVIGFGYYDFEADIAVIEDELVMRRTRSDLIDAACETKARELWDKRKVHTRKIDAPPIVRADMAGEHVRDDSTEYWSATRTDDLRAAANAARVQITRGRVRIHPRCATILAHGKYARWNRQRTGLERPSEAEHHYDGCAALLYFLRDVDRYTNPTPVLPPDVHPDTHYIAPGLKNREREQLEKLFGKRRRSHG
jgi:hypothetical protein